MTKRQASSGVFAFQPGHTNLAIHLSLTEAKARALADALDFLLTDDPDVRRDISIRRDQLDPILTTIVREMRAVGFSIS